MVSTRPDHVDTRAEFHDETYVPAPDTMFSSLIACFPFYAYLSTLLQVLGPRLAL